MAKKQDISAPEAASDTNAPAAEKLEAARQKVVEVATGMREGAGKAGSQIRESAGKASTQIRETAGKASEAAREGYSVAKENVRQGYDRVSKDMGQLSEDVNEYVRHNPGKSVLIAAAVGFFLGAVLRGGRRG